MGGTGFAGRLDAGMGRGFAGFGNEDKFLDFRGLRGLGFVWLRLLWREVLAVFIQIEKGIAVLAVEGALVAAEEVEAGDVIAGGREAGVFGLSWGGRFGLAGEGLPGLGEVEIGVVGGLGVEFADIVVLEGELGVEEGGFKGDEAVLAPGDADELVDVAFFGVVAGVEGSAEAVAVEFEGGDILDLEGDVDDGAGSVLEVVAGGAGFAGGGFWAFGFCPVDAGLLGGGELFELGYG